MNCRLRQLVPVMLVVLTLSCPACHRATDAPMKTDAPEGALSSSAATPVVSGLLEPSSVWLSCQVYASDGDLSWQSWSTGGIASDGTADTYALAADGDLLWASSGYGLARLNVRTGECTIFAQAAGHSLATACPLLPDGEGGLWVGVGRDLLRFANGEWQVVLRTSQGQYMYGIGALGLRQNGDLCVMNLRGRFGMALHPLCFRGDDLPLMGAYADKVEISLTAPRDCSQWQRIAYGSHHYVTAQACQRGIQQPTQERVSVAAWFDDGESWAVDGTVSNTLLLIHRRGEMVREIELPLKKVGVVAADSVRGGVWIAAESGLFHGRYGTVAESNEAPSTSFVLQPWQFSLTPSPVSADALVVDTSGGAWAIGGGQVLRYDESARSWLGVRSLARGGGVVAADPVRGIWVAGSEELLRFDGARWQTWPMPDDPPPVPTALLADEEGRLWMGTLERGIWSGAVAPAPRTGETPDWQAFTAKDGLADERITALARGPDGCIYAAHHAGISVFDPTAAVADARWVALPGSDVGEGRWVNALALDATQAGGGLWAGIYPGALVRGYQDGRWMDFSLDGEEGSGAVNGVGALLLTDGGDLWVGADGGLWRWVGASEGRFPRWETFNGALGVGHVLALAQDAQGHIWVGGREGIARALLRRVIISQRLLSVTLSCRERAAESPSWQNWQDTPIFDQAISDVTPGGLVGDGDVLWISTPYGLIRLNTRTWECAILTEAAKVSLGGAFPLLPDGQGGLWVGVKDKLLHLADGEWQRVFSSGSQFWFTALGENRAGDLQLEMGEGRASMILKEGRLITGSVSEYPGPLDFTDCERWQRVTSASISYASPGECERMAEHVAQGFAPVVVSATDSEIWKVEKIAWGMERLLHQHGETIEWVTTPHLFITALAADPVYGGVWLATEYWLYHSAAETVVDENGTPSTHAVLRPFPDKVETPVGSVHALTVDGAGQVWAASDQGLLRFDETSYGWRKVVPAPHDANAIATDLGRGVWVAGRGKLSFFDGDGWQTWNLTGSLPLVPTALLIGKDGRLWLGTLEHGVWTATLPEPTAPGPLGWQAFTVKDGLADERITALAQGPDGRIYAAHHAGISAFDPTAGVADRRWTTLPGSDPGGGRWVNALAFDPAEADAGLWAGVYPGALLRHYRGGRWQDCPLDAEESAKSVNGVGALLATGDGTLWVGTTQGLWRWNRSGEDDPSVPRPFDPAPAVHGVLALAQDAQGRLWVGGQEGIAVWEEED